MKVAISVTEDVPGITVDPRFGRARKFLLVDMETNETRTIDNAQNLNAAQGAGIQAAQTVIDSGAQAVITGNCGPKAFRVLTAAGIQVYTVQDLTVKEALLALEEGRLSVAAGATVEGHWV